MSVTIEIAPSLAAVETLGPAWAELWAADPLATPFGHPAWLLPWARVHAPDGTRAVLLRQGGLVGLVPFFSWEGAVLLAGTGPSDYGEAAFAQPALAEVGLAALAREAAAMELTRIDLRQLRPESPLARAAAPEGWRERVEADEVCPVAPILGPEGEGAMPGKWRRKLGYTRRRALDQGGWTSERADASTLDEIVAALLRLHAQRWEARGEPGVLAADLTVRHIRAALPELLAAGLLHLHALRHRGRIAAAVLALEAKQAIHFYIGGFDPALSELGPGTLLLGDLFAEAAREGLAEAHFLRGRERYKHHWGAEDRPTLRRVLDRG